MVLLSNMKTVHVVLLTTELQPRNPQLRAKTVRTTTKTACKEQNNKIYLSLARTRSTQNFPTHIFDKLM